VKTAYRLTASKASAAPKKQGIKEVGGAGKKNLCFNAEKTAKVVDILIAVAINFIVASFS
jgi:hypothetical protein